MLMVVAGLDLEVRDGGWLKRLLDRELEMGLVVLLLRALGLELVSVK